MPKKRGEKKQYRESSVQIGKDSPLYEYCCQVTEGVNCIYNSTLFFLRQLATGLQKSEDERFPNETYVIDICETYRKELKNKKYNWNPEEGWIPSDYFIERIFRGTRNEAFFNSLVPSQTSQQAIREAVERCFAFVAALEAYHENQNKFTGKPKLPNYLESGGRHMAILSNQASKYDEVSQTISFPKTKLRLKVGKLQGRIKHVKIVPYYDIFKIAVTTEIEEKPVKLKDNNRYLAIDLGVNNFAAIVNNFGEESLLFKGGVVKSLNQRYNKLVAKIVSEQTKGTNNKFVPTDEFYKLCKKRNNSISDFSHKVAKAVMDFATAWNVAKIIVGENKGWKQRLKMKKKNKQDFSYIPFDKFKWDLKYLCEAYGISIIFNEESYTSKASYLDRDEIPVYGEVDKPKFSGRRTTRGNYKASNDCLINADLNGAANIGRKATGNFENVNFDDCIVFKHPDYIRDRLNTKNQKEEHVISKSKHKRDRCKAKAKSNPIRIGLCE